MTGRPSTYSEAIADDICERIIDGGALYRICQTDGFPSEGTVYRWLEEHEGFREKYARARELQQDREADHIVVIADETEDPQKARLQIDARKWRASKLAPKKYGDKLDLNHTGTIERLSDDQLDARLSQLLGKIGIGTDSGGTPEEKG